MEGAREVREDDLIQRAMRCMMLRISQAIGTEGIILSPLLSPRLLLSTIPPFSLPRSSLLSPPSSLLSPPSTHQFSPFLSTSFLQVHT